jgi:hypothetical protein
MIFKGPIFSEENFGVFNPKNELKISVPVAHCAFSSNLFHGQIVQIAILQLSDSENKKCSP